MNKEENRNPPDVPWIKNGKCINEKTTSICNLGWACDGCPWNKDIPKTIDEKKISNVKTRNVCCACKKEKKIVNTGSPPLCESCYPLACNWSEAMDRHQKFMRSVAGIGTLSIDTGCDDDIAYMLELMAEDLAEAKMKLKQTEVCMINICTMLRNQNKKEMKKWDQKKQ